MDAAELDTGIELRRLPDHQQYKNQGISFIECDGWLLPGRFLDLGQEVALIEQGRGYIDFSDRGVLRMEGKDAVDLLHRISTNDFRAFEPGKALQTVFLSEKGRVVDSVVVLHRNDHLLVLTSRGAHERVAQWVEKFIIMEDVTLTEETGRHFLLLQCNVQPGHQLEMSNRSEHFIFGTKYFDLECVIHGGADHPEVRSSLASMGLMQVGNEAYEMFRIRRGIPSYGREIVSEYNPLELGLRGQMSFEKGCYIGQEVIARLDTYKKVQRKLFRVHSSATLALNRPEKVLAHGKEAGILTSSVCNVGERLGSNGVAILKSALVEPGTQYLLEESNASLTIDELTEGSK